ncbi:MAG TPA: iron ABC transporter permease [Bacilli bacterium]|nr:iron ABC transporter permease [Bacilli bacterium]
MNVVIISIFLICAVAGTMLSLGLGSVKLSFSELTGILLFNTPHPSADVIWNIRLPRTIVALFVGINLAVAGALLQAVLKNPLADPHIIGITSGAGLAGIIILILFPHHEYLLPISAFFGALIAATFIYILAWKNGIQATRVILAGVAISAFFGAGISGLMIFYSDRVHGAIMWMAGSLSARSWIHVEMILPYTLIGVTIALFMSRHVNALLLGDEMARGLGIHVERTRLILTATAALLAASAVSVVGLLGFVGLIVPHAVRLMVGSDYRFLLPGAVFLGIAVITISDTAARLVFAPVEIPVGVIMAGIGAPFFLYLLRRAQ